MLFNFLIFVVVSIQFSFCSFPSGSESHHHRVFEPGTLVIDPSISGNYTSGIAPYVLELDSGLGLLSVKWNSNVVLSNVPGKSLLGLISTTHSVSSHSGYFALHDGEKIDRSCKSIRLVNMKKNSDNSEIVVVGEFEERKNLNANRADVGDCPIDNFSLRFGVNSHSHLSLRVDVVMTQQDRNAPDSFNELHLSLASTPEERIHGIGIQNTFWNLKGQRIEMIVSEHGVGRGKEPITSIVNHFMNHGGGNPTQSYGPIPFFIAHDDEASVVRGVFFPKMREIGIFDFAPEDMIDLSIWLSPGAVSTSTAAYVSPNSIVEMLFYGAEKYEVKELIHEHSLEVGKMLPLPEWFHDGLIVGLQGGTERVRSLVQKFIDHDVQLAGVWLQDWSGQRPVLSFGVEEYRLWWNWDLNTQHYPDWHAMVDWLREKGNASVLTYLNPFFVDVSQVPGYAYDYWKEAKSLGLFIRDAQGSPYVLSDNFNASIIDLTNLDAWQWTKVLIERMFNDYGIRGYMLDFGEYTPLDGHFLFTRPSDVKDSYRMHNSYPELWQEVNLEVIKEWKEKTSEEIAFFTRSAFSNSPSLSVSAWAGDQLVRADVYDGLKSSVVTLLTSGVSCLSNSQFVESFLSPPTLLCSTDIGGYTSFGIKDVISVGRPKDLLLRWLEMSAFTLTMRSHEGMDPKLNAQLYDDDESLDFSARQSKIFGCMKSYRMTLMVEADKSGIPPLRHLELEFPTDPNVLKINHEQFMLGEHLLVAPVMDEKAVTKEVYLPHGSWVHVWTLKEYNGAQSVTVSAELGMTPLFYPKGSVVGEEIAVCMRGV